MIGLTQKQQDIRLQGIGSSEIAALAGLSPWQTPFDVYNRKLGISEPYSNNATLAGQRFEPVVAEWAAELMGWGELEPGGTMIHPEHDWIVATPDFFVVQDGERVANVEVKTTSMTDGWGDPGTDEIVDYYRTQVEWQMAVAGLEVTHLPVFFFGSREIAIYRIERSPELFAALFELARDFWHNHVLAGEPPPIDGTEGCAAYLKALHKTVDQIVVPAPPEALAWAEQLAKAKADLKRAEALADEAENHLRAMVGSAKGIEGAEFRYTWSMSKSSGVDYRGLATELLGMLESAAMIGTEQAAALVKAHQRAGTRRGRFTPRGALKEIGK